jgi:hypothetical protein
MDIQRRNPGLSKEACDALAKMQWTERQKRLTLSTFDSLQSHARIEDKAERDSVRINARKSL